MLKACALVLVLVGLGTAGCGGGVSGDAKAVQDGLNAWLVDNASSPTDVGKASSCKEVGNSEFRCTIRFPESEPYDQTYTCNLEGLCTNGAIHFRRAS